MHVRLLGQMSGTRDGVPWPPRGSVVDLTDEEAISLCRNGMAVPMERDDVEKAVDNAAENRAAAEKAAVADSGGFVVEVPDPDSAYTDEEVAEAEERDRARTTDELTKLVDDAEAQDEALGRDGTGRPLQGPGVVTTPAEAKSTAAKKTPKTAADKTAAEKKN